MESICRLCFQPAALFQVPGYNLPTCVKCSEHLSSSNNLSANFYQNIRQDAQAAATTQAEEAVEGTVQVESIANTTAGPLVGQDGLQNQLEIVLQQQLQPQHSQAPNNQNGLKKQPPGVPFELEKTMQNVDVDMLFNEEGSCPLCSKTFSRKSSLLTHIRNHSAERKFVCTYCHKGFTQAANLRNHERIHTNDRPYVCGDCGKTFTQITNLNNHRRLHTGERPFVCIEPECGRSFAQVTNLNNHMKTHHKVQQYCCNLCPKKFTQVTSLNQHLQAHAGITGFYCPRCPEKSFKQQSQLHTHMKSHGLAFPFECQKCDEKFLQQAHLDQHNKMHDEFKFKCDMCPSSFNQEGLLKKHVQRHIEGRYITCPVAHCNQAFAVKQHLSKHLLTRHSHSELPPPKRSKKQLQPAPIVGHSMATSATPGQRGRPPKKAKLSNLITHSQSAIKSELQISNVVSAAGSQIHIDHMQPPDDLGAIHRIKIESQVHHPGTNSHQQLPHLQQQVHDQESARSSDDLKCYDCGVEFSSEGQLRDHIFHKHPERRFMQAILEENKYLMRIQQNQQSYVCNLCCNVFKTQLALVRHTAKFHGQLL